MCSTTTAKWHHSTNVFLMASSYHSDKLALPKCEIEARWCMKFSDVLLYYLVYKLINVFRTRLQQITNVTINLFNLSTREKSSLEWMRTKFWHFTMTGPFRNSACLSSCAMLKSLNENCQQVRVQVVVNESNRILNCFLKSWRKWDENYGL